MVDSKGIDLRCGAGQVAALTCPRHVIHYRSRSIPMDFDYKSSPRQKAKAAFMVDSKGIEPSNLTDANRALSQLSYEPICNYFNGFLEDYTPNLTICKEGCEPLG